MSATRTRAVAAFLCGLWLVLITRAQTAPGDDKSKVASVKTLDLAKLPNEELLKQATAVHAKASGDYLAAARALAGVETQLDDATKHLADLTPPKIDLPKKDDIPKDKDAAAQDAAKAAVDAAKGKADFAKQKLKLTVARKQLQERVVGGVEAVQSALSAFQSALDDLKPYGVEIQLRFADGTMTGARPTDFLPESLGKRHKELVAEEERLKPRLADARKAVEGAARAVEEAEKALGTAEAEATEASRSFAREQQRKETAKKYTGKKPEELLAEVNQLVQDGAGLKGTYELAFRQFTGQAAEADRLRKELAELKQPEGKVTQITRAEDVQEAVRSEEALIAFHTARTQKLEALKANLTSLEKLGSEFEADAAVSDEHLFTMQVVAGLLDKSGAAEKLPTQAGLKRLADAAERAKKLAAEVRAGTTKARADLPLLEKQLAEAKTAGTAAAAHLASLKQTQDATLAALRFEEQLGKLATPQAIEEFNRLRKELTQQLASLKTEEAAYQLAANTAREAQAKYDALKDPLLRAAEEQGQAEKQRILADLRKEAGLDRAAPMASPMAAPTPNGKPADEKRPEDTAKKSEPLPTPLERTTAQLTAFQQQLAARVRVVDEREEKAKTLLAALDDLDAKATTYSKTLASTRQTALQLNAAAVDIKKRVGRGDLDSATIPEGVTAALSVESRKKFDADSAAVLNALSQVRQDRDALRKPDPDADALRAASKELLAVVGKRIDLLGDLKKLAADYRITKKDRSESAQKRLDQTATDRMEKDAGRWDWLLRVDKSQNAASLSELLQSYYRELIEIEEKEENLKQQKKRVDELLELAAKERTEVQKATPLLAKELARLDAAREEESVLVRASLKPEAAEELLKAHQTKTGRMLAKPLPVAEKERAAKVEQLGGNLFQRHVEIEAAKKWQEIIAGRLAPTGLTAEAGTYQDELAELNAVSGGNARRVHTLTGNPPPEPGKLGTGEQTKLPATGGEIGRTRAELTAVQSKGVKAIGIRIGIILLVAFLLPRILMFVLRRALGGNGSSTMVFTALGALIKVTVWVTAFAVIMSALGFDVTAIIAGLGIGGLAIGLAAQPMLADVIGAIVIFAERRFKIGDVIRLGNEDPARVVGLSWRSTALKNSSGLVVTVPNRKVTEAAIQNLTKSGQSYDSLSATITTTREVAKVLQVILDAMAGCKNLSEDHGVAVKKFNQKGDTKVVEYRFWWFLHDYEERDKTRDEVFERIAAGLADENMAGTEVTLT